jgi:hypothetical protein
MPRNSPCSPPGLFRPKVRVLAQGNVTALGLALDEKYIEGFVEGCLERIGEGNPEEELLFRDLFEDETQRDVVIESLKADCEVRTGRPACL